jgi:hypothetical protein
VRESDQRRADVANCEGDRPAQAEMPLWSLLPGSLARQAKLAPASLDKVLDHSRRHRLSAPQHESGQAACGLRNKEIAQTLGVTPKTVVHHTSPSIRGSECVGTARRTGRSPLRSVVGSSCGPIRQGCSML